MDLNNFTNLSVFNFLYENKISFDDHKLAAQRLSEFLNLKDFEYEKMTTKLRKYCTKLVTKWQQSSRTKIRFLNKHKLWLNQDFSLDTINIRENRKPDLRDIDGSNSLQDFQMLGDRQKRRKTDYLKQYPDEHIKFVAKKLVQSPDAKFILDFVENYPEHIKEVRSFCESLLKPQKKEISKEQALSVFVAADLTKNQYNFVRKYTETFPSYYQIQKAKLDCYPPEESMQITETSVKINLQSLLDKTTQRILCSLDSDKTANLSRNYTLICKWGCDGASDQSEYNIAFTEAPQCTDSNVFICSLVPIRLHDDNDTILWNNDHPSSIRYCRPIQFHFVKESEAIVKSITEEIENEIQNLSATSYESTIVNYKLVFTMVDGKIINIKTDIKSSMRCFLCLASPKEMNNLELIKNKTINKNNLSFGISSLHAWIRCFECLLHIAYNLPFKSWSANTEEKKILRNARKTEIQNQFRIRTGLLIDVIKQGKGNTNNGNAARRFFSNPRVSAEITGLDHELINRFNVILKTIASGEKINISKFRDYCYETAQQYIRLYDWFYMPVSMHKLLLHGADIAEGSILPIGQLSEEAQEANHKMFRLYRESHSRKFSRKANNEDVFKYLLVASDPLISSLRPQFKSKTSDLPDSVLQLLEL